MRVSIAVFSVASVKVAFQSSVFCDAFINTDISSPLHVYRGVGIFIRVSNLEVGMCSKGPMCKK